MRKEEKIMEDTVTLAYGGCKAVVRRLGAQIISFQDTTGREVIWQGDPSVWPQHAPLVFPVCGSVKDNQVKIGGTSYPMPKHGFTRNVKFDITKLGDDFVELTLGPNEENRTMYPFDFRLHVTYTMVQNGFTTSFLIENLDSKPMPFCVGGHPGFICPMENGASFTDYELIFDEIEEGKNYLAPGGGLIDGYEYLPGFRNANTLPLSHDLFDPRDALLFCGLKSRGVKLVHKQSGHGIRFTFPKFEVLAVWSKPGANADYVCLEPWHGMPESVGESGNLEDKPYATILAPNRAYQASFTAVCI